MKDEIKSILKETLIEMIKNNEIFITEELDEGDYGYGGTYDKKHLVLNIVDDKLVDEDDWWSGKEYIKNELDDKNKIWDNMDRERYY